jgi:hypothetical protein
MMNIVKIVETIESSDMDREDGLYKVRNGEKNIELLPKVISTI